MNMERGVSRGQGKHQWVPRPAGSGIGTKKTVGSIFPEQDLVGLEAEQETEITHHSRHMLTARSPVETPARPQRRSAVTKGAAGGRRLAWAIMPRPGSGQSPGGRTGAQGCLRDSPGSRLKGPSRAFSSLSHFPPSPLALLLGNAAWDDAAGQVVTWEVRAGQGPRGWKAGREMGAAVLSFRSGAG